MFSINSDQLARHASGIKKSALGVSLAMGLGGLPTAPQAALSTAVLSFTLGTPQTVACNYGTPLPCTLKSYNVTDIVGSWFSMDTNDNGVGDPNEKTPIESFNGIFIGDIQAAANSHTGPINGTESPNIDEPWEFFGNTGMHQTTSPVNVISDLGSSKVMDFSGWNVNWNALASIPVVSLSDAVLICDTPACTGGESYVLDGAFHVAGAGFTTVGYNLHLEGKVALLKDLPAVEDDAFPDIPNTIKDNPVTLDVLDNDFSATDFDFDSLSPDSPTAQDGTAARLVTNSKEPGYTEVRYTPKAGFTGMDATTYSVDNLAGTSDPANITIDVQDNVAPVAVDDVLGVNVIAFGNAGGMAVKNVIANDTDDNNAPGQPGGIDPASVTITGAQPAIGTCTANPDGTITYSQPAGTEQVVTESCTYTISDLDVTGTDGEHGLPSAADGTLEITISDIASDWPADDNLPFGDNTIPILFYEEGEAGKNTTDRPVVGSYFGMELSANDPINGTTFTPLKPYPANGLVIGYEQPTEVSHSGAPHTFEETGYDAGWNFFGGTGFTKIVNGGIRGNAPGDPPGTLRFRSDTLGGQGRYIITWNGIPDIDLGGDANVPEDLGFATINCDTEEPVDIDRVANCANGEFFDLAFAAHVPEGDPSGFGGVPYTLFLKGVLGFIDGTFQSSAGTTVDSQDRMAAGGTGTADPDVILQCVGSCVDYSVSGVTAGGQVKLVVPLAGGVPLNPVWRILDAGVWRSFDTSAGDTIKSAPLSPGDQVCPAPGDAAYVTDPDTGQPVTTHLCIELTVRDFTGGNAASALNDLDPTPGVVGDASGLGSGGDAGGGAPPAIVLTKSSTSGCSLSDNSLKPQQRSEWWLLAGFLGWLGWTRRKTRKH